MGVSPSGPAPARYPSPLSTVSLPARPRGAAGRTTAGLAAVCLLLGLALAAGLFTVGLVAVGSVTAVPARAQEGPLETAGVDAEVPLTPRDRILAVVNDEPVLASDVERAIVLGLARRDEGEAESLFRRRVLEALVEQTLRFQEVERYGFERVPVDAIEEQVELIRGRFESPEEFQRTLDAVGLDIEALRQLVARQLMVWVYFEESLGPRIFVSLEDIRAYYENTLVPEARSRGAEPPPLATVREDIRRLLQERRLNEEVEAKTRELRLEADIVDLFDTEHDGLPPVAFTVRPGAAIENDG